FGNSAVALRIPDLGFALAMAVTLWSCILLLTGREALARWLALAALLIPSTFFYARAGPSQPSALALFFLLGAWAVFRFGKAPSLGRAALAGVLLGGAIYAYTAARLLVPLTVVAAVAAYSRDPSARKLLWPLPVCAAVMAVPMGVFML